MYVLQPEQYVPVYNQCCFISHICKLLAVSSTNTDQYQPWRMVGGLVLVDLFSRRIFLVPTRFCMVTWLSGHWNEISLKAHWWSQRSLVWNQMPLTPFWAGLPGRLVSFLTQSVKEGESPQEGHPRSSSPAIGGSDSSLQVPVFLISTGKPLVTSSSHHRSEPGPCPRRWMRLQPLLSPEPRGAACALLSHSDPGSGMNVALWKLLAFLYSISITFPMTWDTWFVSLSESSRKHEPISLLKLLLNNNNKKILLC